MSLIVKVHKKDARTIISVCDKELVGKIFSEEHRQLDLSGEFYNGEEMSKVELGDLMRNSNGVNLVGKEACNLAVAEGVIEKDDINAVQGVPHAQVIFIE
ncbi:DUF424 family protein [Candidatus Woesearchaeota archaeon]|nr:DUF424 family protein [Candidatus Woesearchaeota archaeon]